MKKYVLMIAISLIFFRCSADHSQVSDTFDWSGEEELLQETEEPVIDYVNEWYAALDGVTGNAGTIGEPFRSIETALEQAQPGDIVYIRGGDYRLVDEGGSVSFPRNGEEDAPITLSGYPGEEVRFIGSVRLTGWELHDGSIYRTPAPAADVHGLFEDDVRVVHPLYMDGGTRIHPPLTELTAPGTWTLQEGYVYLWSYAGDDPDNHAIEASQTGAVHINRDYVIVRNITTLYTQSLADAGGGVDIRADHVRVINCTIGRNSAGNGNAYAVYFFGCSDSRLSDSTVFDSVYWGGMGADQNSHLVSLIASGDDGANVIEHNEIYDGGLGVGSKGANTHVLVRDNYIHDVSAGVRITGERSSGPGAGWTDRGHYRVYRNIFENNTWAVRISGETIDDRVFNNVFINNEYAVGLADYTQQIYNTQIANNIFIENDFAVHLSEKFYGENSHYGEETFQYFKQRGLKSSHNLFYNNTADWANQLNDWGSPTMIIKTYEEIYTYNSYGWEAESRGEDPLLDTDYHPLTGSPAVNSGRYMGLPYNGDAPDMGLWESLP